MVQREAEPAAGGRGCWGGACFCGRRRGAALQCYVRHGMGLVVLCDACDAAVLQSAAFSTTCHSCEHSIGAAPDLLLQELLNFKKKKKMHALRRNVASFAVCGVILSLTVQERFGRCDAMRACPHFGDRCINQTHFKTKSVYGVCFFYIISSVFSCPLKKKFFKKA